MLPLDDLIDAGIEKSLDLIKSYLSMRKVPGPSDAELDAHQARVDAERDANQAVADAIRAKRAAEGGVT